MADAGRTPQEINADILGRLDVAHEFEQLGVRLAPGAKPRASGMLSCFAYGREDNRPSAWINCRSGYFGDSGGADSAAYSCSLWDFAVKVGRFPDWKSARKSFADKVGVKIGREKKDEGKVTDWREKLDFQTWDTPGNLVLAQGWCIRKPGVTVESIRAAGGQMAYYPCWIDSKTKEKKRTRDCRQVIAIPAYGAWLLEADPAAWVLWDVTGQQFDVTPKDTPPTEPRQLAKMVSCGPTAGTFVGLSSLMMLCDQEQRERIELVWKVEGPADMLSLWASLPPDQRDKIAVVTQAGGATADVPAHQTKLLAGLRVAIVGDMDEAGQAGAVKWARALHGIAREVRVVKLPWPIERAHGKDVRDFVTGEPLPAVEAEPVAELVAEAMREPATWPGMP
jgi:hypothetical protein